MCQLFYLHVIVSILISYLVVFFSVCRREGPEGKNIVIHSFQKIPSDNDDQDKQTSKFFDFKKIILYADTVCPSCQDRQ